MSKIAVSCEGPSLDAPVDPRFGRAAGFLVVDSDTLVFDYLDNGASQVMAQGAGIQAAERVVRAGARVVLTGVVGPKALQVLEAAGIQIGQHLEQISVRQALERFKAGQVPLSPPAAAAPARGAYGAGRRGARRQCDGSRRRAGQVAGRTEPESRVEDRGKGTGLRHRDRTGRSRWA
jgi:predicted Fe-Mo cluster-binding NifX family protein